ncbi:MAG: four helix bundle protein [Flavobacteriaceae bacterium]|nr:four helix bundle protein [Flavobacteriaceae bacterium]
MKSHKDLKVWKESMDLVILIYELMNKMPLEEQYGLTSQIRRAVVSVPSNIAEGAARKGAKEFCRFLDISLDSLSELETQIEIGIRLKYLSHVDEAMAKIFYRKKMLSSLIKSLS